MSYIILIFLFAGVSVGFYNSIKNTRKRYQGEGKYLCVPCGYVYDPTVGDPDSGIAPGTAFEDIPETWRCPVCGVTKNDFIPLGESKKLQAITVTIVQHKFVNNDKNVLLLEVKIDQPLVVQPGQYMSFIFHDADGEFRRSYSIVKVTDNIYTFLIRILKPSRGGGILESKKVGDTLEILGVFGNFLLQPTDNKKVFIGTGTGLAPLFHMILTSSQKDNILLFGSKNLNDAFYIEELAKLESVKQVYVYLSREETLPEPRGKVIFIKGRMNFEEFFKNHGEYAGTNTEFYLCGNPNVVHDAEVYLQEKKYPHIFTEKF